MAATGELLDLLQDGLAVKEELVADDECDARIMSRQRRVDLRSVGVNGVGRADDFRPMLANAVLGRVLAIWCLASSSWTSGASSRVGRRFIFRGSVNGTPRKSPINSSAALLNW